MLNLYNELNRDFLEVSPKDFYRDIFKNDLDEKDKFTKGKYTGIACEFFNDKKSNGKQLVKRYSITNDLDIIDELLKSDNFIIISPVSYFGKERKTANATTMYAFGIEIDGMRKYEDGRQIGYDELLHQFSVKNLPCPNYIVASGSGLHLYYVFESPLILFENIKKSLMNFKRAFTRILWNKYITDFWEEKNVQYESAFQGFRMVGGVTKSGDRTKVFKVSDIPCSIKYLNDFVWNDDDKIEIAYKSELTLLEAKFKHPEWYDKRIIKKEPKGRWIVKRDLYDWWLREIREKRSVGHRYYCVMCLCVYAIKCNIDREELEKDCLGLLDLFDSDSLDEKNRFTVKDISDALQCFEDKNLVTYPIDIISKRCAIPIKKNKRNYQKQKEHLEIARAIQIIKDRQRGTNWRDNNGRKDKKEIVLKWRKNNPKRKKSECIKETGLTKPTVYRWWDWKEEKLIFLESEVLNLMGKFTQEQFREFIEKVEVVSDEDYSTRLFENYLDSVINNSKNNNSKEDI